MLALTLELQDEHDFISKVNSFIKNYNINMNKENLNRLNALLQILREFVSNCHHKKEEIFIFPYLLNKGGDEASLANKMIDEHRKIENLEAQIEVNIHNNLNELKDNLIELTSLLDSHIQEENTVVFAYAEFIIDDETKDKILKQMIDYEKNNVSCNREKYEQILESLNS